MQKEETTIAITAKKDLIGPSTEPPPEKTKMRIEFLTEPADKVVEEATAAPAAPAIDLKTQIADRVRTDCKEQGILTSEETLIGLAAGNKPHDAISAALAEMTKDPGYADIKAVTTASGLVFFYSERHIKVAEAAAKSLLEEVKFRIGERVRADSRDTQLLTPVDGLYGEIGWDKSAYNPDEIRKDPRYEDIKTVTASSGEQFFYSTRHMSDYFAVLLSRVAAHDPCATIAETVRDESRIYPRPTCVLLFKEKLFGMNEADLKEIVDKTLQRPEYGDLKMMVHPATGGVYLYSSQHMDGDTAFSLMDWQEVGKDANP
jgi:hypothetical protein